METTILNVLINCRVVGKVIVMPEKLDSNAYLALKLILTKHGGTYYPSVKNRGFLFKKHTLNTNETQELLDDLILKHSTINEQKLFGKFKK